METSPRLKVSSDRLVEPGIEPVTPCLQDKWLIHYTTAAPRNLMCLLNAFKADLKTKQNKTCHKHRSLASTNRPKSQTEMPLPIPWNKTSYAHR